MKKAPTSFVLVWQIIWICQVTLLEAQTGHVHPRMIQFPDVPGYHTMVCDFHQHTVFSDGNVWPSVRVQEALRDSLDAISLTEHLESQAHKQDIPHPDRNRSYEIAKENANAYGLIVVHGAEITREMPPGHTNAIFIKDANALMQDKVEDVFKEAGRQEAFLFWNHPDWVSQQPDGIARLTDIHKQLIADKLLHGIEVVNDLTYSDEALQIALDYNLTIMGTSDIHGLVDWQYKVQEGGHRPVTLVFAKEKTAEAIKEGLLSRRTVVWYKNNMIGREADILPLIQSCIEVGKSEYFGNRAVAYVTLTNHSDVDFILANRSSYTLLEESEVLLLPQHTDIRLSIKTLDQLGSFVLDFEVLNAITAPGQHPVLRLDVKM